MNRVPVFLCPRCAYREAGSERNVRHQPRGCSRCGFGFAFELLEDYYASPKTALIVCDQERRILVAGLAGVLVAVVLLVLLVKLLGPKATASG